MVQSVANLIANPEVMISFPVWPYTFVDIDCEIFSTVFFLFLIQEGLLSVTSESKCREYWITLPRKSVARLPDCLNMTMSVKAQTKQNIFCHLLITFTNSLYPDQT